ncbi:MAG: FxDxF family PEP-CTERM protein [Azoarcus sp.]|jgi:hypothetical protein|nr:FxDxF family PEP-CTERM protein [Azoarcus sp.]
MMARERAGAQQKLALNLLEYTAIFVSVLYFFIGVFMMHLKKTVAAIVLGFGFAAVTQAAPIDLGELSFTTPLISFANPQGQGGNDYSFSDTYSFTVANDVTGTNRPELLTTTFSIDFGQGSGMYSLDSLAVTIYGGSDTTATPVFQQEVQRSNPGEMLSIYGSFDLDSSAYTLVISGMTSGPSGGAPQGGLYAFTLHAVPEPETYAMMLAGLGIVGVVARRRRMTVN